MVKIVKHRPDDYQLQVTSPAGNSLLKSISFKTKSVAQSELASAISNPLFERRTDYEGAFVFVLKTAEGKPIGQSNSYRSEAGMENGIKNLKNNLFLKK